MKLRFFELAEFACKCGRDDCRAVPIDMTTALKLDGLRLEFGQPMIITSGSRCYFQNRMVGGEKDSQHLLGKAVDVACPNGFYSRTLLLLAIKHNFTAIGVGKGFLHMDTRPGLPLIFGYSKTQI